MLVQVTSNIGPMRKQHDFFALIRISNHWSSFSQFLKYARVVGLLLRQSSWLPVTQGMDNSKY